MTANRGLKAFLLATTLLCGSSFAAHAISITKYRELLTESEDGGEQVSYVFVWGLVEGLLAANEIAAGGGKPMFCLTETSLSIDDVRQDIDDAITRAQSKPNFTTYADNTSIADLAVQSLRKRFPCNGQ